MQRWAARSGLHAGLHGCAAQRLSSLTAWINGTSTLHALCKAMCGLSVSISYDMRFWCVVVVRRRISKGVVCGAVFFGWVLCVLCGAGVLFVRLQVFRAARCLHSVFASVLLGSGVLMLFGGCGLLTDGQSHRGMGCSVSILVTPFRMPKGAKNVRISVKILKIIGI